MPERSEFAFVSDSYEQLLTTMLASLVERGFGPPVYFAMIGIDGSMAGGHLLGENDNLGNLECHCVMDYTPQGGIKAPVRLLFLDPATGHVAGGCIDSELVEGPEIIN